MVHFSKGLHNLNAKFKYTNSKIFLLSSHRSFVVYKLMSSLQSLTDFNLNTHATHVQV